MFNYQNWTIINNNNKIILGCMIQIEMIRDNSCSRELMIGFFFFIGLEQIRKKKVLMNKIEKSVYVVLSSIIQVFRDI